MTYILLFVFVCFICFIINFCKNNQTSIKDFLEKDKKEIKIALTVLGVLICFVTISCCVRTQKERKLYTSIQESKVNHGSSIGRWSAPLTPILFEGQLYILKAYRK